MKQKRNRQGNKIDYKKTNKKLNFILEDLNI